MKADMTSWCRVEGVRCPGCGEQLRVEYGRLLVPGDRDFRYQARETIYYDAADPTERHHCPRWVPSRVAAPTEAPQQPPKPAQRGRREKSGRMPSVK